MIDDIAWFSIPVEEWKGGSFGIYDDHSKSVMVLKVRFADDANTWHTVPTIPYTPKEK